MAMIEDYRSALRAGQRAYRACVARGQSPYLAVLDDILNGVNIVAQEPLGLVDIPRREHCGHQDQRAAHSLCGQLYAPAGRGHRVCHQVVESL